MREKKNSAQQDTGRTFQRATKPNATEYEKAQEAFRKNFERLKAERLARETENPGDKERNWSDNKRGSNPLPLQADHDRVETTEARTQDQDWAVRDVGGGCSKYAGWKWARATGQETTRQKSDLTHIPGVLMLDPDAIVDEWRLRLRPPRLIDELLHAHFCDVGLPMGQVTIERDDRVGRFNQLCLIGYKVRLLAGF
jgi:hypothetical protein